MVAQSRQLSENGVLFFYHPSLMTASEKTTLQSGLQALNIVLSSAQQQQLLDYVALLDKWNHTYNLTAIRTIAQMIPLHLLDSLAILPYLHGTRHIDVGTGAGLPGIPLAIALPQQHFTLLDSNGKKTRFLLHVKHQLGLNNIEVIQQRVETYQPSQQFDTILTRAFSDLIQMVAHTQHLCAANGIFLAMKGQLPASEISQLHAQELNVNSITLQVPGVEGKRLVLKIAKKT